MVGIPSAEAVGFPPIAVEYRLVGIASAQAFGVLQAPAYGGIERQIAGIASAQAFGSPTSVIGARLVGISSAQAFGFPGIPSLSIRLVGIATGQAFGTPDVFRVAPATIELSVASRVTISLSIIERATTEVDTHDRVKLVIGAS